MTLTEAEILDISEVIGRDTIEIDAQLAAYSTYITAARETKIRAQLLRYSAGTVVSGEWFEATESNRGYNTGSVRSAANASPKTVLEGLLFFESTSAFQVQLVRG